MFLQYIKLENTEKDRHSKRVPFDSLGAYRERGILPGEEIKSAVDKKRNVTYKPFPERQASGRIRYSSDDTTNYAGYRQRRYANSRFSLERAVS